MMQRFSHKLSIGLTSGFAVWLVVVWGLSLKDATPVIVPLEIEKTPSPSVVQPVQQVSVVLPAPPRIEPKKRDEQKPVMPEKQDLSKSIKTKLAPKSIEKTKDKPQASPKPSPKPVIEQEPVQQVHEVTVAQVTGGRALLRVLEHGKGPQIEIAWPKSANARNRLFSRLNQCFGMESVVMDQSGNLFRMQDAKGQRWEINMDRYSGFLREASGQIPTGEQRLKQAILRHHGDLRAPMLVRIFPRRVDASLLGGLKGMAGEGYMQANSIRARYELQGRRVIVRDIRLNGTALQGVVALAPFKRC